MYDKNALIQLRSLWRTPSFQWLGLDFSIRLGSSSVKSLERVLT
jgi:hypothetical protein